MLQPAGRIALPGIDGRIDHMAVDVARRRLFVAEFGNNSLDAVDLAVGRRILRIGGLSEPQGVGYAPTADLVAVANGGDGSVRFYRGADLAPAGRLALGKDADNVRVDPRAGDLLVGYGEGGIATIDPAARSRIGGIRLDAHPEAFALDPETGRLYVNLPDAGRIAVVDTAAARRLAAWTVPGVRGNFPMALGDRGAWLAVVFRRPPTLVLLAAATGATLARLDVCGDADDAVFDVHRQRIYVSCGAGAIDVFAFVAGAWRKVARLATAAGARTSLFVPEFDRLYVAVPSTPSGAEAAILVFRPLP
jgi:hypothetical protein